MQGHFRLARLGDSVDGLLDVHAAACGLIQDPALRHSVAQGGACGRVSHRRQRSVIGAGLGVLLGAPAFAGAVAPFSRGAEGGHAARWWRRFRGRAASGGLRDFLLVGVRPRVFLPGVTLAASESQRPDDLYCAASSVGYRGRVLRGAACYTIVVSLCLRAGGGVRISRGWCTCCGRGGAWVWELVRQFGRPAFVCACGH